jgi:hypothetical protein
LEDILKGEGEHQLATVDELDLTGVLQESEEDLLPPSAFMDGPPPRPQQQSVNLTTSEGAILRQEILPGIANQLSQASVSTPYCILIYIISPN